MMGRARKLVAVLAVGAPLCVGGCWNFRKPGGPLAVTVASEMANLTDQSPRRNDPLIYDAATNRVGLFAAANETIGFQLVIDGGERGVEGLRVLSSELSAGEARIAASNVRVFRALPVRVTDYPPWYLRLVDAVPQPASFYDALVPVETVGPGAQMQLKAGRRLVLWIDVRVPRDAHAGTYLGTVKLTSDDHGDWAVRLVVQVYDFVLPDARSIAAVGGFNHDALFRAFVRRGGKPFVPARMDRKDPQVREGLVVMRQLLRLAHEHRLDLFDKQIHPVLKRGPEGKVRLDWDDYDAVVRPYLDGSAFDDRVGCPAWPAPLSEDWPDPGKYGGVRSGRYAGTVEGIAEGCRQHFAKQSDFRKRMFLWLWRGRVSQQAYDRLALLGRLVRKADPDTPILSVLPLAPAKLTRWTVPQDFAKLVGILAPPAHLLDPAGLKALKRKDHPLAGGWLAPGRPPYLPSLGIIATPADARAIPWFAVKYDCTGLFLPEVLHWGGNPFSLTAGAETRLFYPGPPAGAAGVLPSIRLKRLRRGLQDIAYLSLLRQRRRDAIAQGVVNTLMRYAGLQAAGDNYLDPRLGGWVQDAEAWQMARRLLAEEIQIAVHPSEAAEKGLFARRLQWRQFQERARDVVVEQVRSRVLPTEDGKKLRVQALLDLYNQYACDVVVRVRFDRLPGGWKPLRAEAAQETLPPAARRVIELAAEGDSLPQPGAAKYAMPVTIKTNLREAKQVVAVVPFLTAARVKTPPKIDGVLDDWTIRSGNTAGDFRLIGRRGRSGSGLARRQTYVFVLHDRKNLYLAFRCNEPNLSGMTAKASNQLHYEQLMACGEDLVEVLLDPGCKAKGPEDLYHIAVKPNGVLVTERGVRTQPPLGRSGPWALDAAVAVGLREDAWTVEMSIPLEAFGAAGKEEFWGVNFTRFAVQGAEASNWAEAPRYYYDPKNLGTMYLGPREEEANRRGRGER